MKNIDCVSGDAVKNKVVAVRYAPHATVFVTRYKRIGARHLNQTGTTVLKLIYE
jgi:hypothetical protein